MFFKSDSIFCAGPQENRVLTPFPVNFLNTEVFYEFDVWAASNGEPCGHSPIDYEAMDGILVSYDL